MARAAHAGVPPVIGHYRAAAQSRTDQLQRSRIDSGANEKGSQSDIYEYVIGRRALGTNATLRITPRTHPRAVCKSTSAFWPKQYASAKALSIFR